MFLANYADVFTDAPLPDMIARFEASDAVASLLAVPLQSSHHVVDVGEDGLITQVTPVRDLRQWENGGYFVLRPEIFDYLSEGEDLVEDALHRLVAQGRVMAYPYKGYCSSADTVKERALLEEMYHRGHCPWMIWDPERSAGRRNPGRLRAGHGGSVGPDAPPATELPPGRPLSLLAVGAHPDDIEIGAGGMLLSLAESRPQVRYVVLTGTAERDRKRRVTPPVPSCPGSTPRWSCSTCRKAGFPQPGDRSRRFSRPWRGRARPMSSSPPRHATLIKITGRSARSCPPSSATSSSSRTRSPSGTVTSAAPRSTSRYRPTSPGARSNCCTSASRRSAIVTGGTMKYS